MRIVKDESSWFSHVERCRKCVKYSKCLLGDIFALYFERFGPDYEKCFQGQYSLFDCD